MLHHTFCCTLLVGLDAMELRMDLRILLTLGLSLAASNAPAQFYTGSLHFMRAPELVIERQDVTLAPNQVNVAYVLHNISNHEITETLVLPIPANITINDQAVVYKISQRAISNNGQDISNLLKNLGIPFDPVTAMHSIDNSANRDSILQKLISFKLLDPKDETPEWISKSYYYWQQSFPANAYVTIKQNYKPIITQKTAKVNSNLIYMPYNLVKKLVNVAINWSLDEQMTSNNLQANLQCSNIKQFHTTIGAQDTITVKKDVLQFNELNYDCSQESIWSTPIEHFSLKIISPENMHSMLCWNGDFKLHGKNTLVFEADNYVPLHNINVLYVEK